MVPSPLRLEVEGRTMESHGSLPAEVGGQRSNNGVTFLERLITTAVFVLTAWEEGDVETTVLHFHVRV